MKEDNTQINHFEYAYENGRKIDFDANAIVMIARFLGEVVEKETDVFASFTYPKTVREITNEKGTVMQVSYEDITEHTPESFMMTAVQDSGAMLGLTSVGVKASQILSAILNWHEKNIKAGVAKKIEEIGKDDVFKS